MENITPAKYKCGDMDALCPGIFLLDDGRIVVRGPQLSLSEEGMVVIEAQMLIDALREQGLLPECGEYAQR